MKTTKNKAVYEEDICEYDSKANSIVFPESINEIENTVKLAKHDIVPRGSGINFVGGCAPNNSIVVDMSKMNNIIEIDATRKIAYVEAGVIVNDLNHELEKYGLEFPISPLFSGIRTIGGIIAVNAADDREIKYGKIRNWIDSLEVVNSKGKLIEVSKTDASDYAGMEGITGIIARAKMRLTIRKQRTLSILKSDSSEELIAASKKLKLDHEISMLTMFGKKLSLMMDLENKYHLFVEYEGDRGRMKDEFYHKFMQMKDKAYYTMASHGFTMLENPKFFMGHHKDFAAFLEQKDIPYFCNLGSSTICACFKPDDDDTYNQALEMIKKLRARASYNLGIGLMKKDFFDRNEKNIIRRVKTRLDPDWKFNSDKVIDYALKEEKSEVLERLEDMNKEGTPYQPPRFAKAKPKPEPISDSEKEKVQKIVKDIMEGASKDD